MQINRPIQVLQKKITNFEISYKFKWSQGNITMQPLTSLTPQMLQLVEKYELEPKIQKILKLNNQCGNQINNQQYKYIEQKYIQEENQEHQQRKNEPCVIKAIRNTNKMELLVIYQGQEEEWVSLEYLKKRSPITLCSFLLSKVRWGGNP